MERAPTARTAAIDTPCIEIVEQIAALEDVDPTELQPPLHDVIDPEAVNDLFSPTKRNGTRESGRVRFDYLGYDVVVRGDGRVSVSSGRTQNSKTDE
ncbi:HalOD1 output domain-containing protein [Natrinema halophilum]|uniref:Halobacterial output domain-containing protein n=1 Tax=Natrinema halophilum TaxID=1699371 RepID=A0A7D5H4Z8_9EURY|nr:HalOD1 output domain-containing protein [Natrinema halophilum]QLG47675.1 hypothetical protein HYG82_01850 [Natrinema halophilum]